MHAFSSLPDTSWTKVHFIKLCIKFMFGDIIQIGLSGVSSVWTTKDMFLHRLNPSVNVCGGLFVARASSVGLFALNINIM